MQQSQASATPKRVRVAPNLYQRTKDGKFEAGYTGETGRWHIKTLAAENLTHAKRELRDLLAKRDKGEAVVPSRTTVEEVWRDFENTLLGLVASGERSPRTLERYQQNYRLHVGPRLGRMQIQKVRAAHIAAMLKELRAEGKAPWTLHGILVLLSCLFGHAQSRGHINESPLARLAKGERPKQKSRKRARALSNSECEGLIREAGEGWRALIATAVFTGLRLSELLGLTWEDMDFETGLIRVRFQLSRAKRDMGALRVPLKTEAAIRDVYMLPELAAVLKRHKFDAFTRGNAGSDDFVFCTREGRPLSQRNAGRALSKAAERAGVECSMHDLRHTAISRLIAAGLDVVEVQRQAGHKSPSTTLDVYSHQWEAARRSVDARAKIAATGIGAVLRGEKA